MRRLVRSLRTTCAALTLSVLSTSLALAADGAPWVVAAINGPVVYRSGDSWQEVDAQQSLPNPFIRTLKNGAVRLERGTVSIALGSESIADVSDGNDGVAVLQYLGEVAVSTPGNRPAAVQLEGGGVHVSNIAGVISLIVSDRGAQVTVHEGSVHVAFQGGEDKVLESGTVMVADQQANTVTVSPNVPASPDVAVGLLNDAADTGAVHAAAKGDNGGGNSGAAAAGGNGAGNAAGGPPANPPGAGNSGGAGNPGNDSGAAAGNGNANGNVNGNANGGGNAASGNGASGQNSNAGNAGGDGAGGVGNTNGKPQAGAPKPPDKPGKTPIDLLLETEQ